MRLIGDFKPGRGGGIEFPCSRVQVDEDSGEVAGGNH